jgi:hypothetical protein
VRDRTGALLPSSFWPCDTAARLDEIDTHTHTQAAAAAEGVSYIGAGPVDRERGAKGWKSETTNNLPK